MSDLRQKLRPLREGLGLTQWELASLLQIDRAHLSRLERSERTMTDGVATRLLALRARAREALVLD